MSHNRNFNNNYHGSNYTFRYVPDFPPPPLPPPVLPPIRPPFYLPQPYSHPTPEERAEKDDQDFIKKFECRIREPAKKCKPNAITITHIREEIQGLLTKLRDFETQLKCLTENVEELPEEEWKKNMNEMDDERKSITNKLEMLVGSYMDLSRKLLAKRTAKRLRLKRLKEERKIAKKENIKLLEEISRKIDDNLKKIKDDNLKAEKAEEAKLEADVVLREVRRQKQDAKKYLVKLEALLKLRKARLNTAKGRGETVSEKDESAFVSNIEKLKTLWNQKLLIYEKEETELNAKLSKGAAEADKSLDGSHEAEANLAEWREVLFGDPNATPQVDFHGDVHRFIAVRSQWDQYLHRDGTPIPVGWVVPRIESQVHQLL